MQLNEIVELILSQKRHLKPEDVKRLIQQKIEKASGFLTEEGAACVVASELGISLPDNQRLQTRIKDLVKGLSDVTITGRVLSVNPAVTFEYSDGRIGKRAGFVMADDTGIINVSLWDKKAELVNKIAPNEIVKIVHGYVREGIDGKIILNIASKGDIISSLVDENPEDYPEIRDFFKKIDTLRDGDQYVNLTGTVTQIFPITVFDKKGRTGRQVLRANLMDETGTIRCVFWNDQVNLLRELKSGDSIQVIGAHVKKGINEANELHIDDKSQVSILKRKAKNDTTSLKITKIKDLKEKMYDLNLVARIVFVGSIQNFQGKKNGKLATLLIKDETGTVRLLLWNEKADISKSISTGDIIFVEGGYTKKGVRDIDLHVGKLGKITINPDNAEAKKIPLATIERMKIGQLKSGLKEFLIEGKVIATPVVNEVTTTRGETVKVASFKLEDDTGEIRISVWRELVGIVEHFKGGEKIHVINPLVKEGLGGMPELTTYSLTSIKMIKEEDDQEVIIVEKENSK